MPRLIHFENLSIQVPDDANDQEVASIIEARNAPVTPGGVPVGENGRPRVIIDTSPPPVAAPDPNADKGLPHNFMVGAQGVGAGVRDIALAPFDLAAGVVNLGVGGVNKVFGTEIPRAMPASQMADVVTDQIAIPQSDMSSKERLAYNINRFGTQALGTGAMLAQRAPQIVSQAMPSETVAGRTLDTLAQPYTAAPARTVVGDAVSGVGAGVGNNIAEEYLPKEPATPLGQFFKGMAQFLAPLAGGMGASTVQGVGEGIGGMARNIANRRTDTNLPVSSNGTPFSLADSERAARDIQSRATGNPQVVAQDIRENAGELANPTLPGQVPVEPSQMPTTGLLSRDPGLVTAETGARTRNPGDFVVRDQNVKEAAGQRIQSVRDSEADQGSVATAAQNERDTRLGAIRIDLKGEEALARRYGRIREEQAAELAPVANSRSVANASRNLDRTIVDEGYVPARTEKNRQFDTAPGRGEQLPADEVIAAAARVRQQANNLGPEARLPGEFLQRIEALAPENGGTGLASGGDLADLRKYISTAREAAQRSGNFDLADNIGTLGQAINRTIEQAPGFSEANANYRQFAQTFRPERGDEAAKFTRELDRAGNTEGMPNRGATPPSETAGRFLSSPEKAAALQRLIDASPNAAAGQTAVRDYLRSDFAQATLNGDGSINLRRAAQWQRNNADVLMQFPAVRNELEAFTTNARLGVEGHSAVEAKVAELVKSLRTTEAEIDRSAVGTLLREDPRDVASRILNGGYGAEKQLDEIQNLVKSDPVAARGWKAAVSEVLTDKITSTRKVGETPEVQYARLAKEFKDNEALLAKVYTPEELNTLRQGHKLLEYFKESEKRATTGSNTADKAAIPGWMQLAVRHVYGDLKGGGIIKRFKLLLDLMPTNRQSAEEIAHIAWFNPNVAAYLLERPVKNYDVPQYNINLRRLMAADNAARGE